MEAEKSPLWQTVKEVALEEGVELFDIELPSDTRRGGVLRVYITKNGSQGEQALEKATDAETERSQDDVARGGISFEDCVRVSKKLLDIDEQQEIIPANCTLEVSSPGINRKLRLPSHFARARGERVRVKFRDEQRAITQVLCGHIRDVDEGGFSLEGEAKKEQVRIAFRDVKEARIDFKF